MPGCWRGESEGEREMSCATGIGETIEKVVRKRKTVSKTGILYYVYD